MLTNLARNWWAVVLRGVAAILFGVLTWVLPGTSLTVLIVLFAFYALAEGALNIASAARGAKQHERWGFLLFEGLVSLAAGIVALVWPGLTALALLYWIAAWALITGALEIAAAVRLRRELAGEWLLALSGVASIVFGVLLIRAPGPGALAVLYLIGAYAVLFGILLCALGMRLRAWMRWREVRQTGTEFPSPA
jgi:uncharacterized membrane protein HdeD (DUF308 family)